MGNQSRGMTLIEVLVVTLIITMLAIALVVLISGVIERQKVDKTNAMVQALASGCETYRSQFGEYPPTAPYTSSQNLHYYLASEFDVVVTVKPRTTKKQRPILPDFRHDWIEGAPTSNDPASVGARHVVDAWGTRVTYTVPGPTPYPYQIRSFGPDMVQGGGDDTVSDKRE